MNQKYLFFVCFFPLVLTACGGGGGGTLGTYNNSGNGNFAQCTNTTTLPIITQNQALITVEQMPSLNGLVNTIDMPYTTVTICNPNTSQCLAVPHVLVDTGSYGLRILDTALTGLNLPPVTSSSVPLYECAYFLNSFTFGAIVSGVIKLGNGGSNLTTSPTSFQLIDSTGNNGPCSTAGSTNSGSQQALGANGIIGIGNLRSDSVGATYYTSQSPTSSWNQTTTPSTNASGLVVNPILQFSSPNNNGSLMTMLPISSYGACSTYGTLSVGLTSTNLAGLAVFGTDQNGLVNASVPAPGFYSGNTLAGSFVDSGSNEIFVDLALSQSNFGSNSSPDYLYNPNASTAVNFTLTNPNNINQSFSSHFTVTDPTSAFSNNYNAIPNYVGPENGRALDLGFPYFYGHSIAFLILGQTVASYTGPMIGIQ